MSATDDAWVKVRDELDRETVAAILAVDLELEDVSTSAEFRLSQPVVVSTFGKKSSHVISKIRVTSTRLRHATPEEEEEDDGRPFLRAEGWGRPATMKGEPDMRQAAYWHAITTDVVGPLLGRAFTM